MHNNKASSPSPGGLMAAAVFGAIALFLIFYTWVPSPESLIQEQGQVLDVTKRPNNWYEASIATQSGLVLKCRGRKAFLPWGGRCPIEALAERIGETVTIRHNRKTIYTIESRGKLLLGFAQHRKAQGLAGFLALLLLGMAYHALQRV